MPTAAAAGRLTDEEEVIALATHQQQGEDLDWRANEGVIELTEAEIVALATPEEELGDGADAEVIELTDEEVIALATEGEEEGDLEDGVDAEVVALPAIAYLPAPPLIKADEEEDLGDEVAKVIALPSAASYLPKEEVEADEADLGLNAWFAEEKRREFLENPSSVPESWRRYFEHCQLGLASGDDT